MTRSGTTASSPGAMLMVNTGPQHGEAIGDYSGDRLYHASRAQREYQSLINQSGFETIDHVVEDPRAGERLCRLGMGKWRGGGRARRGPPARLMAHLPLILPSLSNCEIKAQRSLTSFSFLIPAKTILVPGIFAFGSLMYSLNWASFQVMPEFLLASE